MLLGSFEKQNVRRRPVVAGVWREIFGQSELNRLRDVCFGHMQLGDGPEVSTTAIKKTNKHNTQKHRSGVR